MAITKSKVEFDVGPLGRNSELPDGRCGLVVAVGGGRGQQMAARVLIDGAPDEATIYASLLKLKTEAQSPQREATDTVTIEEVVSATSAVKIDPC